MTDFQLIPILGHRIETELPDSWTTHAYSEVQLGRRVIRIYGPSNSCNLFGPPTYAKIFVYIDKVGIERVICTNADFDLIQKAVVTSTNLPVEVVTSTKS